MITPADLAAHANRPRTVPLRASVVAVVVRAHIEHARTHRDAAHAQRRAMARVYGDPDEVEFWRDSMATAAIESDARADEHERIARVWAGRVDNRKIVVDAADYSAV